ncbi:hypothetical protein GCM10009682_16100 [Luedemannella flava]|uniref:Uncharacterized protein n=1 Tax=Luedemannella flava TaxID=349316 RepID=A0ABP4XUD5_9ACTN
MNPIFSPFADLQRFGPASLGDVIHVRPEDYRTGRGPLLLRVTYVGETQVERDGVWRHLYGVQLRVDETAVKARWVLVRVTTLHTTAVPSQRLPDSHDQP